MTWKRAVGISALVGVLVPLGFLALQWMGMHGRLGLQVLVEGVMLAFWPSSIFLMASRSDTPTLDSPMMMALVANVVLYIGLGLLLWAGLKRSRTYLVILWAVFVAMGLRAMTW